MFDTFSDPAFAEQAHGFYSVLDYSYFERQWVDLMTELTQTFDDFYETRYVIIDVESGKPMNRNAVLTDRKAAEDFLKIVGPEKHEIAIMLITK